MRHWFLSYNTKDAALMDVLYSALKQRDVDATIFFAPKNLSVGRHWLPELAKELAASTAFVLLVGRNGIGQWQNIEYEYAFDRRVKDRAYPVILILLEGEVVPGLPFLEQLHRIVTSNPASQEAIGRLLESVKGEQTNSGELWRHTAPYRGLASMTESDSTFFFGREDETVEAIKTLAVTPEKLPILLGNSGVGKSSLAQAGILAALVRQRFPARAVNAGPWPHVFEDSRLWCFLTMRPGKDPLLALVEAFLKTWQYDSTDPRRAERQNEWVNALLYDKASVRDLLDATDQRFQELDQSKPPTYFLYIDQGEELYVHADSKQRQRFSEIIARGLSDPRLRALMSMRSDLLGELHKDRALFDICHRIDVLPLNEIELREVVTRPAELLSARFEREDLAGDIAQRAAEESTKDAGALPLLSYMLDDMWTRMVERGDGILRLPKHAMALGGVLVERANIYVERHPAEQEELRRIFTLKLATVRPDGEPMRRRALRSEFIDTEWRMVSELANHPHRLLVTTTDDNGEVYAEVAHEAIFVRWNKLKEWIAAEREFLTWRSGIELAYQAWRKAPDGAKSNALLMGHALAQARLWLQQRGDDLFAPHRDFIKRALSRERTRRMGAMAGVAGLAALVGVSVWSWLNSDHLKLRWVMLTGPSPVAASELATLPSKKPFQECAMCPTMVVIPAGEFMMGTPQTEEKVKYANERPPHPVKLEKPFAVSRTEVTFEQWDTCFALGGCTAKPGDQVWGRENRPVINVSWDDAQEYVRWLSRQTGKKYRLLSEAEWEYAARGQTTVSAESQLYSFGNEGTKVGDYAWYRGNSDGKTQQVGQKIPNTFGLYDMHGNVWEWVEDCYVDTYIGAPPDGSARTDRDCKRRIMRGGSWFDPLRASDPPLLLRSGYRLPKSPDERNNSMGFRVARTIGP